MTPATRAATHGLTARVRRYLADVPPGFALTAERVAEVFKVSRPAASKALWAMAQAGELTRSVLVVTYRTPITTGGCPSGTQGGSTPPASTTPSEPV